MTRSRSVTFRPMEGSRESIGWASLLNDFMAPSVTVLDADAGIVVQDRFVLVDTAAGNVTVTLPPANGSLVPVTIKNIGSAGNDVIVDGDAANVEGAATHTLLDGERATYISDGTDWWVVS